MWCDALFAALCIVSPGCRLHAHGIEVLLDVVYNHTVEGDDHDPYTLSWRGIENSTYYMVDPGAKYPVRSRRLEMCSSCYDGDR
jgi:hypothetical protein